MKLLLSVLLVLLGLPASSAAGTVTARDIAVLRAAIHSDCGAQDGRRVVLSISTAPVADFDIESGHLNTAVRVQLVARNRSPSILPMSLQCKGVSVVSDARIDELLADRPTMQGLSEGFNRAFPKAFAILAVSLPSYSNSGKAAFVFMSYACGTTCGSTTIVKLKLERGSWRVVGSLPQGIS
jgi:hypothetical protein